VQFQELLAYSQEFLHLFSRKEKASGSIIQTAITMPLWKKNKMEEFPLCNQEII